MLGAGGAKIGPGSVAGGTIVKLRVAGVASTLPAVSIARTENV